MPESSRVTSIPTRTKISVIQDDCGRDNQGMTNGPSFAELFQQTTPRKVIVSVRTLHSAIENALMTHILRNSEWS